MGEATTFGSALSRNQFGTPQLKETSVSEKLENQFTFYTTLLKNYVKYSHEMENLPKSQILERVTPIMNRLIERYKFGSRFSSEISMYINARFVKPASKIYDDIKQESGLDEGVFEAMMEDLHDSPLIEKFSSKFRLVIS